MKKSILVLAGCIALMSVGACVGKGKAPPPVAAPVIVAPRG